MPSRVRRAARIANPTLRAERARQLERDLRLPARSFLAKSGGARLPVPEEYPSILIAAHDGRFDEALGALAALRRRVPWFYEAWTTEASILQARSNTAYASGDTEQALALLERAHAAFHQALSGGQSDAEVHEGLCGTAADVAGLHQELARPARRAEIEEALATCAIALEVAPHHPSTLSQVGRAMEFAARFFKFQEGDGERASALLDRAAILATKASDLEPAQPDIQLNLLTILVTQSTFGQVPDAAWLARLERSARVLEANLRQEHGSLDFILLLQAYSARQQWSMRQLQTPTPDLQRLIEGYTQVHESTPRSSMVPANLVYALRTLTQNRDLYGDATEDLDGQMLRLADEAVAGNPRFVDPQTSLAVALTYNATRRCSRGEEWRSLFRRAESTLAATRALGQAPLLAGIRTAWVQVAETQCALARGEDAEALAALASRSTARSVAFSHNDGMTIELQRTALQTAWRALLADPRTSAAALARAAALPVPPAPEPTPLAALNANEILLTQADLALELDRDPGGFLAGVEERLARVETELPAGARRPLALDRQLALLRLFRARASEEPIGRSAMAAAGAQLLALPLAGTRADLGWLYWRQRIARLLGNRLPPAATPSI